MTAAHRRLAEEVGIDCEMKDVLGFLYRGDVGYGLTEWEYGHVIIGHYDGTPHVNQEEVEDWKWVAINWLKSDIRDHPRSYTAWFGSVLDAVETYLWKSHISPSLKFETVRSY